jgi:hypothetical protein
VIDQNESNYLNIIRKIRIQFAHDMKPLSFTSEEILPLCKALPVPGVGKKLAEPKDPNERMRRRFIEMTYLQLLLLIGDLDWTAAYGPN